MVLLYAELCFFCIILIIWTLPVCLSAPPQALCQDLICGDHEFCGGNAKGETACLCRAIFADPFRSTDSYSTTCSGPVKYTTTELTVDSVFIFI